MGEGLILSKNSFFFLLRHGFSNVTTLLSEPFMAFVINIGLLRTMSLLCAIHNVRIENALKTLRMMS